MQVRPHRRELIGPFVERIRALPESRTLTYFQINTEASREEWEAVAKSHTLAIRLNEK